MLRIVHGMLPAGDLHFVGKQSTNVESNFYCRVLFPAGGQAPIFIMLQCSALVNLTEYNCILPNIQAAALRG